MPRPVSKVGKLRRACWLCVCRGPPARLLWLPTSQLLHTRWMVSKSSLSAISHCCLACTTIAVICLVMQSACLSQDKQLNREKNEVILPISEPSGCSKQLNFTGVLQESRLAMIQVAEGLLPPMQGDGHRSLRNRRHGFRQAIHCPICHCQESGK